MTALKDCSAYSGENFFRTHQHTNKHFSKIQAEKEKIEKSSAPAPHSTLKYPNTTTHCHRNLHKVDNSKQIHAKRNSA